MILFKRKIIFAGLAFLLSLALFSGVHQGFVDVGTFKMEASQVNDPSQNQTRNPILGIDINVSPQRPNIDDPVNVEISVEFPNSCWSDSTLTGVRRDGNSFYVRVIPRRHGNICAQVITPITKSYHLGRLKPGSYQVVLTYKSNYFLTTIAKKGFRVSKSQQIDKSWSRVGYDLGRTHFYPFPTKKQISVNNYSTWWETSMNRALTADLDNDGDLEVIASDGSRLAAYTGEGKHLWSINEKAKLQLISDVTGDSRPEILVNRKSGDHLLEVVVYDATGRRITTLTRRAPSGKNWMVPREAADFDQDGKIEIVSLLKAAWVGEPRGINLIQMESGREEYYYDIGPAPGGSYAFGDIDQDGNMEAVLGGGSWHNGAKGCGVNRNGTCTDDSDIYTIAVNLEDGSELFTKSYLSDRESEGKVDHAIADLDGNGKKSILAFESHDSRHYPGRDQIHLINHNGEVIKTWQGPKNKETGRGGLWAIGDLDLDGKKEILAKEKAGHNLWLINHQLKTVGKTKLGKIGNMVINDINGDGEKEIILTDQTRDELLILNRNLEEIWGYQLNHIRKVLISDLNGDRVNEIILTSDAGLRVLSISAKSRQVYLDFSPYPEGKPNTKGISYFDSHRTDRNPYYEHSLRFLNPNSWMKATFTLPKNSPFQEAILTVRHLTSKSAKCPNNGYSPVTIRINGKVLVKNYDVAEHHAGSHGYESDRWEITDLLTGGENTIQWQAGNLCTHYWLRKFEIEIK